MCITSSLRDLRNTKESGGPPAPVVCVVSFILMRQNANQLLKPSEGLAFANLLLGKASSIVKKNLEAYQKKNTTEPLKESLV